MHDVVRYAACNWLQPTSSCKKGCCKLLLPGLSCFGERIRLQMLLPLEVAEWVDEAGGSEGEDGEKRVLQESPLQMQLGRISCPESNCRHVPISVAVWLK